MVLMSRRAKVVVIVLLAVLVAATAVWAWFLSQRGLGADSSWSSVLQGFAAMASLAIGVLAFWTPGGDKKTGRNGNVQIAKISRIRTRGIVNVNVRQDQRP